MTNFLALFLHAPNSLKSVNTFPLPPNYSNLFTRQSRLIRFIFINYAIGSLGVFSVLDDRRTVTQRDVRDGSQLPSAVHEHCHLHCLAQLELFSPFPTGS